MSRVVSRIEDAKEQELVWLDNFLLTGNATQSCLKAGYADSSSRVMGSKLRKRLAPLITERGYDCIASLMPNAISTLSDCLKDRNGMVKMKAVEQILAISGIAGIERKEVVITHKTDEQIDAELVKLLNRNKDTINITALAGDAEIVETVGVRNE